MDNSDDDVPLAAVQKADDDEDDDASMSEASDEEGETASTKKSKESKKKKSEKKKKKSKKQKKRKQASEDEDADDDEDATAAKPAPKRKRAGSAFVLDEAEEDASEDDSDFDDEDMDESGSDDSIINDESESEAESEGDVPRKRTRTIMDKIHEDDDEDITELLVDNLGDQAVAKIKKQRRRLVIDSDGEDEDGLVLSSTKELGKQLFASDEAAPAASANAPSQTNYATEGQEPYSSDSEGMSDFIDDDEGGEGGEAAHRPKTKSRNRGQRNQMTNEEREFLDIFGAEFDPGMFLDDVDEFDDVEGEGVARRPKRRAAAVFEPSEVDALHLSSRDAGIKKLDVPERHQLWYSRRRLQAPTPEDVAVLEHDLEQESRWCFEQLCKPKLSNQDDPVLSVHRIRDPFVQVPTIKAVLQLFRWENRTDQPLKFGDGSQHDISGPREVPFIAQYRKEEARFPDVLNMHDLWEIQELDRKWDNLSLRRSKMLDFLVKIPMEVEQRAQFEETIKMAQNELELDDVNKHLQLQFDEEIRAVIGKLPRRRDDFFRAKRIGLLPLTKHFGLSPLQVAENLERPEHRKQPERSETFPEVLAEDFLAARTSNSGAMDTPEKVLEAMQRCVAFLLFVEPRIRSIIRDRFFDAATVTVRPTTKGKALDDWQPFARYRYLTHKRVSKLLNADFLWLLKGEKEGLLEVTFGMPQGDLRYGREGTLEGLEDWLHEVAALRDDHDELTEAWNHQRKQAINYALHRLLLPMAERDLRKQLREESEAYVKEQCANYIRAIVNRQGFDKSVVMREEDEYDDDDFEAGLRVVAVKLGSKQDRTKSFVAYINSAGDCTDWVGLDGLLIWKKSKRETERSRRFEDFETLQKFIEDKRPDVIAVCADTVDCRSFISELEGWPVRTPIELVDGNIASVYAASVSSKKEFPEYEPGLRAAISIGRRLQSPEIEMAGLFTSEKEVLCLQMHPLQDMLPRNELYDTLSQEMMTVVNRSGVDINAALVQPHKEHVLQFVAGLGPRKAAALLSSIRAELNGRVWAREQLFTMQGLGVVCAHNCAGFLVISDTDDCDEEDVLPDQLDATRVHPESYELAYKIAMDAMEVIHEGTDDMNMPPRSKAAQSVGDVMLEPEKLQELDLENFATELRACNYGNKNLSLLTTLSDIAAELERPFRDHRHEYRSLNDHEKFMLLTGETLRYPPMEAKLELLAHQQRSQQPELFFHDPTIEAPSLLRWQIVEGPVTRYVYKSFDAPCQVPFPPKPDEDGKVQCQTCFNKDFPDALRSAQCPGKPIGFTVSILSGIRGFVRLDQISDNHDIRTPADRVAIGQIIQARITNILVDRFSVDLSCKTSVFKHPGPDAHLEWKWDPEYDYATAEQEKQMSTKTKDKGPTYTKRLIDHPNYMNVTFNQAMRELKQKKPGHVIVRPGREQDHLTLTWKVMPGVVKHIDIREESKETAAALGKRLYIKKEVFEDIDEILARYISPMQDLVRMLCKERKFDGNVSKDGMAEKLMVEKQQNKARIPYGVVPLKNQPGHFLLCYVPTKPKFEMISVTPEGYKFRLQTFAQPGQLLNWFKKHWQDAMVPRDDGRRRQERQQGYQQPPPPHAHQQLPGPPPMPYSGQGPPQGAPSWEQQQHQPQRDWQGHGRPAGPPHGDGRWAPGPPPGGPRYDNPPPSASGPGWQQGQRQGGGRGWDARR
eukprot:m.81037 g.81037  ORF g.81037 m.81037 type:complete len:1689 (+) comp14683_c0_seq1:89-5155(+)